MINWPVDLGMNMPDTFHTWFLVTELHVWMLMVRLMNEGKEGRLIRNGLVNALWDDVEQRSKQLGVLLLLLFLFCTSTVHLHIIPTRKWQQV